MKHSLRFALLSIVTTGAFIVSQLLVDPPNDQPSGGMDSLGDAIMITLFVTLPLAMLAVGLAVMALVYYFRERKNKSP